MCGRAACQELQLTSLSRRAGTPPASTQVVGMCPALALSSPRGWAGLASHPHSQRSLPPHKVRAMNAVSAAQQAELDRPQPIIPTCPKLFLNVFSRMAPCMHGRMHHRPCSPNVLRLPEHVEGHAHALALRIEHGAAAGPRVSAARQPGHLAERRSQGSRLALRR